MLNPWEELESKKNGSVHTLILQLSKKRESIVPQHFSFCLCLPLLSLSLFLSLFFPPSSPPFLFFFLSFSWHVWVKSYSAHMMTSSSWDLTWASSLLEVCHCARQQLISLHSGLIDWNDLIIINLQDKGGKWCVHGCGRKLILYFPLVRLMKSLVFVWRSQELRDKHT